MSLKSVKKLVPSFSIKEHIVQCHKNGELKIYPILYDVDPDPSDVRNQRGSYEVAFSLHRKKFNKGIVQRWRDAPKVVGGSKGLELKMENDGREGELVKQVVEKVVRELKNYTHIIPGNLVGMDNPIKELMGYLGVDSNYVSIPHGRSLIRDICLIIILMILSSSSLFGAQSRIIITTIHLLFIGITIQIFFSKYAFKRIFLYT